MCVMPVQENIHRSSHTHALVVCLLSSVEQSRQPSAVHKATSIRSVFAVCNVSGFSRMSLNVMIQKGYSCDLPPALRPSVPQRLAFAPYCLHTKAVSKPNVSKRKN